MRRVYIVCILSLVLVSAAGFVGRYALSAEVFWLIRVPRVLMSFSAGAILSVCGMIFQAMFRNPLATPYTLGVASGATLGAAIFYLLSAFIPLAAFGAPLFAFVGALGVMFVVYAFSMVLKGNSILLVGVALNFFFSSIIMFIQYISGFAGTHRIIRFMIGGLDGASFSTAAICAPFVVLGFGVTMLYRRELDLVAVGDDIAAARGVDIVKMKYVIYITTSLMIGCVVSFTGPIGFVGMMAPHICRLIVGENHSRLAPASLFFGGAFLTVCDTFARTIIFPSEIPVGVITSMLGAPFFIFLFVQRART